jgi:hypothetical protein
VKEKKRARLLQKAINHATKTEKRCSQIAAQPEATEAGRLRMALVRRKEMG